MAEKKNFAEWSAERTTQVKKDKIINMHFTQGLSARTIADKTQKKLEAVELILDRYEKKLCYDGFIEGDFTHLFERAAKSLIEKVFAGDMPSCKYAIELHKKSTKGKREKPVKKSELGEVFGGND